MEGRLVEQVGRDTNSIGETHNRGIHPLACSFVFPCAKPEPTAQILSIFVLLICPSFTLFSINFSIGSRLLWHERVSSSFTRCFPACWNCKIIPCNKKIAKLMPGALSVLRGVRDALGLPGYTKKFITWHFSQRGLGKKAGLGDLREIVLLSYLG